MGRKNFQRDTPITPSDLGSLYEDEPDYSYNSESCGLEDICLSYCKDNRTGNCISYRDNPVCFKPL